MMQFTRSFHARITLGAPNRSRDEIFPQSSSCESYEFIGAVRPRSSIPAPLLGHLVIKFICETALRKFISAISVHLLHDDCTR